MQSLQNMQSMQNLQNKTSKPNLPNQTYLTQPTKPKLLVKVVNAWVRSAFGNIESNIEWIILNQMGYQPPLACWTTATTRSRALTVEWQNRAADERLCLLKCNAAGLANKVEQRRLVPAQADPAAINTAASPATETLQLRSMIGRTKSQLKTSDPGHHGHLD